MLSRQSILDREATTGRRDIVARRAFNAERRRERAFRDSFYVSALAEAYGLRRRGARTEDLVRCFVNHVSR